MRSNLSGMPIRKGNFFGCMGIIVGLMFVAAIAFYVIVFVLIGKGCNHVVEEGDGSFIQGIGKVTKNIENEFNEGYDKDTTANYEENR